jgi:hypothetical protein
MLFLEGGLPRPGRILKGILGLGGRSEGNWIELNRELKPITQGFGEC